MSKRKQQLREIVTRKISRLVKPRSIEHVHLIEDHLDSMKPPMANKMVNKSSTKSNENTSWGKKKALSETRQKEAKERKMDLLHAELRNKIELLKSCRMSKSGKTPKKKQRESKKIRREKNRNKPGLGSERSVMKNKHKIMKLTASKIANRASKHQLLIDDTDSDE